MIIDCHSHHISAPYNTNYLSWVKQTGHEDYGRVIYGIILYLKIWRNDLRL